MPEKVKMAGTWPGKVEILEHSMPTLKDDQILVRVELTGICGTDAHVFEKGFGPHRISGKVGYPLYLGHEYVGVVEKKGKEADKKMFYHTEVPQEGDRIWWGVDHYCYVCDWETMYGWQQWCLGAFFYGFDEVPFHGAWSRYVIIEPGTHIWKLAKHITPEKGVVVEPYIVGLRAVDKVLTLLSISEKEANPDADLFVIYGAGAIGNAALTALKTSAPNSIAIVVDPNKHRLEMAKKLGADYVLNVKETTKEERIKFVKEIATSMDRPRLGDRWGVDAVIDCTGKNADVVIPEAIEILRPMGVLDEVGAFTAFTAGKFTIDPHEICARELFFVGSWAYPLSTCDKAIKQVNKGLFDKKPYYEIITHMRRLLAEDITDGIKSLLAGVGIKHVIDPWKE